MTLAETSSITLHYITLSVTMYLSSPAARLLWCMDPVIMSNTHAMYILKFRLLFGTDIFSIVILTNSVTLILIKQVRSVCVAVWTDTFWKKKVIKSPVLVLK